MDTKLTRIVTSTGAGSRPLRRRQGEGQSGRRARFELEADRAQERAPDTEPRHDHEDLQVAPREAGETGGHLDLSA